MNRPEELRRLAKELRPCQCSMFRTQSGKTTGCTSATFGIYAPGHDAKLKSFLIEAGVNEDIVTRSFHDPQLSDTEIVATASHHAADLGWAVTVYNGIDREIARKVAAGLDDLGQAKSPKTASDELTAAARRSDEEANKAVQDRESSTDW
jgi:precorrin-3B methylase